VQHHHAHLAACLADNGWDSDRQVIGVIFDGTGLGTDGKIWGGEFLIGNYAGFKRPYHLAYYPLPGGDASVRQPRRLAATYLWQAGLPWEEWLPPIRALDSQEREILTAQLENGLNTPLTSSMGRLFDAVASLIGIRQIVNYEAQAAIELEHAAALQVEGEYPFAISSSLIDPQPLLAEILEDLKKKTDTALMAARFHRSVVNMVQQICERLRQETGIDQVALSGGVWQNMLLLRSAVRALETAGFQVLTHRQTPPNDGCIALGQVMIADQQLK